MLAALPGSLEGSGVLWVLLVIAGFLAGVINTIAGGGSFLTLPLLMALGLPPGVANGTNRVGVVLQNVTSVATFRRQGRRDGGVTWRLAIPMAAGALGGAWVATQLDDATLRPLFGGVLLAWALYLVLRPGKFKKPPEEPRAPGVGDHVFAVLIGVYGGFLQAGVGFPLMALLVTGLGYDPVRANAVKVALVLVFTGLVALPVFLLAGQVAWGPALVMAGGTMLGGWAGTHWQIRAGAGLVRWFVVVMVAVSGVLMIW